MPGGYSTNPVMAACGEGRESAATTEWLSCRWRVRASGWLRAAWVLRAVAGGRGEGRSERLACVIAPGTLWKQSRPNGPRPLQADSRVGETDLRDLQKFLHWGQDQCDEWEAEGAGGQGAAPRRGVRTKLLKDL